MLHTVLNKNFSRCYVIGPENSVIQKTNAGIKKINGITIALNKEYNNTVVG
ncbi:MAG: hypothetical protein QXZ44_00550 [Ferroplasma sp.]